MSMSKSGGRLDTQIAQILGHWNTKGPTMFIQQQPQISDQPHLMFACLNGADNQYIFLNSNDNDSTSIR